MRPERRRRESYEMTSLAAADLGGASADPCDGWREGERVSERQRESEISHLCSRCVKLSQTDAHLGWRLAVRHHLIGPLGVLQGVQCGVGVAPGPRLELPAGQSRVSAAQSCCQPEDSDYQFFFDRSLSAEPVS